MTFINRPVCKLCNIGLCKKNGVSKKGTPKYKKYCSVCEKRIYNQTIGKNHTRKIGYTLHKKHKCENCGFVPIHPCQLDVDHIDGNKYNNDISNLKTLCANCHRIKTYLQRNPKI